MRRRGSKGIGIEKNKEETVLYCLFKYYRGRGEGGEGGRGENKGGEVDANEESK